VLPPRLPAATMSGQISTAKMATILDDLVRGRLKVLFVSPERLTSGSFRRMFVERWNAETKLRERRFPTVSLLCVDEAHCLSQWAHNFRPSYLRLASMIDLIQPKSLLAITATAGPRVVQDICQTLGILDCSRPAETPSAGEEKENEDTGVRIMKTNRDNINVTSFIVDNHEQRINMVRCARVTNTYFLNEGLMMCSFCQSC
jgi:ATP-dependent DNA helicase Q4